MRGPYATLAGMKESYHICFTSHDEVMFRDDEDHGMFVNLMALRAFELETGIIVDAEMSTHAHLNIFTDVPTRYSSELRSSYTKYFNRKYGRKGRFGQKYTYVLKVEGFNHQMVLENYINRNGMHHAAAPTAFGYKYCSARDLFSEDIGFPTDRPANFTRADIASRLPRRSEFPDSFQMNADGFLLRQSFMEIRTAEKYYGTPRNYLYQMNRLTDETWILEQQKDNTGQPITLAMVEQADEKTVAQLLNNEHGRTFGRLRLQDLDVCRLIDKDLLPGYGVETVYLLSSTQKVRLAKQLYYDYHLPEAQIRRCLVLE